MGIPGIPSRCGVAVRLHRWRFTAAKCWPPRSGSRRDRLRGLPVCVWGYSEAPFSNRRSICGCGPPVEPSGYGRSRATGCATPRPRSSSTRWERICGKSRNCSATRIFAQPCAIPMSAMNRHGRRRKRSATLWSENAAAGTTHPAHNNEVFLHSVPNCEKPLR
jgi:hypothetical protein